jgi:hypothetical protein
MAKHQRITRKDKDFFFNLLQQTARKSGCRLVRSGLYIITPMIGTKEFEKAVDGLVRTGYYGISVRRDTARILLTFAANKCHQPDKDSADKSLQRALSGGMIAGKSKRVQAPENGAVMSRRQRKLELGASK